MHFTNTLLSLTLLTLSLTSAAPVKKRSCKVRPSSSASSSAVVPTSTSSSVETQVASSTSLEPSAIYYSSIAAVAAVAAHPTTSSSSSSSIIATSTSSTADSYPTSTTSSSGMAGPFSGTATVESVTDIPGGGACGPTYPLTGMYTAVHPDVFNSFPTRGGSGDDSWMRTICGKQLVVTYQGQTQTLWVGDSLPIGTPRKTGDLDMGATPFSNFFSSTFVNGAVTGVYDGLSWEWA